MRRITLLCIAVLLLGVVSLANADSDHLDDDFPSNVTGKSPVCWKWTRMNASARKGVTGVSNAASWVSVDGTTLHTFGGCGISRGSNPGLKHCSSAIKSLDLKSQIWTTEQVQDKSGAVVNLRAQGAAVAYDSSSNAMFVFGGVRPGRSAPEFTNQLDLIFPTRGADGKPLKGAGFSIIRAEASGDAPMGLEGAKIQTMQKKLFLFGGATESGLNADVYTLNLEGKRAMQWTKLAQLQKVAHPAARRGHSFTMINDNTIFMYGGSAGEKVFDDAWILTRIPFTQSELQANRMSGNGGLYRQVVWTEVTKQIGSIGKASGPGARSDHSAVYSNNKLYIFGGCNSQTKECFDDLLVLDTVQMKWVELPASLTLSQRGANYRNRNKDINDSDKDKYSIRSPSARRGVSIAILPKKRISFVGGCTLDSCEEVTGSSTYIVNLDATCPNSCGNEPKKASFIEENGSSYDLPEEDGAYRPAYCACTPAFHGQFCQFHHECPNGCSRNGVCVFEQNKRHCKCKAGFWGKDCSFPSCPKNCNGRGVCSEGPHPEYVSSNQSESTAAIVNLDKLVNHIQVKGKQGVFKFIPNDEFKEDAAGQSHCACRAGFSGLDCSLVHTPASNLRCPNDCSGHGLCSDNGSNKGKCQCHAGFTGVDCTIQCPNLCSGNGVCSGDGICKCNSGFTGLKCDEPVCVNNCYGHGTCTADKQCKCVAGWGGAHCNIPTSCSGHGQYKVDKDSLKPKGECTCDAGWGNDDCSQPIFCPKDCSGHGTCHVLPPAAVESKLLHRRTARFEFANTFLEVNANEDSEGPVVKKESIQGECKCAAGWTGQACEKKKCEHKCKHGFCNDIGKCSCYPGHQGEDCSIVVNCTNNCTSAIQGTCSNAKGSAHCECKAGWHGLDCSTPGCPKDCNAQGKCKNGHCYCNKGFSGTDCGVQCPNKCSEKGNCVEGKCSCYPGFEGKDCSKPAACPKSKTVHPDKECAGHGFCFRPGKKCICDPGYTGIDCATDDGSCGKQSCNKRGTCRHGLCYCDLGFSGKQCEIVNQCKSDCNGRGFCLKGKCHCYTGFQGEACEKFTEDKSCPKNCSKNGLCQYGRCFCMKGYDGVDCSVATGFCAKTKCSGNGECKFGKCHCQPGSSGLECEKGGCKKCNSEHGVCMLGKCVCKPGWSGEDCSREQECPEKCSNNGVCVSGSCACLPGFSGKDCSQVTITTQQCPKDCSGNGACHAGRCFCAKGFQGPDCSIISKDACLNNCSGQPPTFDQRGKCFFGQCFCKPGYTGKSCETKLECPSKCEDNGVCLYGKCFCAPNYTGPDCQQPIQSTLSSSILEVDMVGGVVHNMVADDNKSESFIAESSRLVSGTGSVVSNLAQQQEDASILQVTAEEAQVLADEAVAEAAALQSANKAEARQAAAKAEALTADAKKKATEARAATDALSKAVDVDESNKCGSGIHGCSGHGVCVNNECICMPGFGGRLCSQITGGAEWHRCGKGCSDKGKCLFGKCFCDLGWSGKHCDEIMPLPCPNDCSGHGTCHFGKCVCDPGFMSEDCSKLHYCNVECSSHGICFRGKCVCAKGFAGYNCNLPASLVKAAALEKKARQDAKRAAIIAGKKVTTKSPSKKPKQGKQLRSKDEIETLKMLRFKEGNVDDSDIDSGADSDAADQLNKHSSDAQHVQHHKTDAAIDMDESNLLQALSVDESSYTCEKGCGEHGRCIDAKCFCEPSFHGEGCTEKADSNRFSLAEESSTVSGIAPVGSSWKLSPVLLILISFSIGILFSSLMKVVLDRRRQQLQTTLLSKPLVSMQSSIIPSHAMPASASIFDQQRS